MAENDPRRHLPAAASRRGFLGATAATAAAALGLGAGQGSAGASEAGEDGGEARARLVRAYRLRVEAARAHYDRGPAVHETNGDEERYPDRIASFAKTLPHDALGQVVPAAYDRFLAAARSGLAEDWDRVPGAARLANPSAATAFSLEGADAAAVPCPPPPAFASKGQAGEMVELYWMALARDVPFAEFEGSPVVAAAAAELAAFPGYAGSAPRTLFRGPAEGDQIGPYVSQFLLLDIPWGATALSPYGSAALPQRYRVPRAGDDHMLGFDEWLRQQRGGSPSTRASLDPELRYTRTPRDLTEYVHRDFTYQAGLGAALILLTFGAEAWNPANPYLALARRQAGFVTFGGPHVLDLVARVSQAVLKAAWFEKWCVHRRLRPEEFAGRMQVHKEGRAEYPIDASVLGSEAAARVHERTGGWLLPQAYPEGCPAHPSYPAGHATLAGATSTILKAFFDESFVIPRPVVPTADGLALDRYDGVLTVGGELNKLASNIARSRDIAGVHWLSDGVAGILQGEALAISVLRDQRATLTDAFSGWRFTGFDGRRVTI